MCKPAVTWSIKAIIFWLLIDAIFLRSIIFSQLAVHSVRYLSQIFSFPLDDSSVVLLETYFISFAEACLIFLFICFILRRKRASLKDIGIQLEIKFRTWSGFTILGALFGAIVFFLHYHYKMVTITPANIDQTYWPFTFGTGLIILGLLVPFIEEVVFRGILFQSLKNQMSVVPAIAVGALIFVAMHNYFFSWVHFIAVLLLGCITCIIFFRTGSLTNACIFHASGNSTGIVLVYIFYVWN